MNPTEHYKVRCKCTVCDRTQVRKITDLLNGAKCFLGGGFSRPPCNGALIYYADDPEDAQSNAIAVLGYLNAKMISKQNPALAELVDSVVDDVQTWSERELSPQEMGWVGQNGLP